MADLSYQPTCVCQGDVEVYQKRHRTITVKIEDPDDDLGDITNAKLWFSVKQGDDDEDSAALLTKKSANNGGSDAEAIVITPTGALKEVQFYVVPNDTDPVLNALALPGDYLCDAVIELATGTRLQLLDPRRFTIFRPITVT